MLKRVNCLKKYSKKDKIGKFRWPIYLSISVMILSVMATELLIFINRTVDFHREDQDLIIAIGMIPIMGIIIFLLMSIITKIIERRISILISGVNQVSDGNFEVQLDYKKAGEYTQVYKNFNLMVKELNTNQHAQQEFMNNFSHEFKTPITSINGFAKLLLESKITEEEKKQYLEIIAEESERLAGLAQNTLLLNKVETQQIIVDKKVISLDEQIKQCIILLSSSWKNKKIDMIIELEAVEYIGNSELLKQVWINLLSNAIKFTTEGGTIIISMRKMSEKLVVEISDSGIGISDEIIKHIFEKYYQADNSHSIHGYGLGLAIVKRIIDLYEGKISAESVEGKGTTFIVELPLK